MFYPSGVAAKKGTIILISVNGAMAVMSNQLKSRLESGVTTPRLHQVKTGQKRSQLTLHCSLMRYGCSKNTKILLRSVRGVNGDGGPRRTMYQENRF